MSDDYADVRFRIERGLGWITLNRPNVINALNHEMIRHLDARLASWADDDRVNGVVLTGAGERGLCAGGDIVSIYHDARVGGRASIDFWHDEYVLDARIAAYPKPYLAIMDGIVMGGGVGLSAHGSIRVVTDQTRIAMPEVGIGLCPDVGAGWLLNQAPGELGTHIALTGAQFSAGDAIATGLADHYLPAEYVPAFLNRLSGDMITTAAPTGLPWIAPASPLQQQAEWIDACYTADTVAEILDRLRARAEPKAIEAAGHIAANSPIALSVTLQALRKARELPTLHDVLGQDLRISSVALESHDLVEGIRARVIDKDRRPCWSPPTLADITPDMIDRYFATPPVRRLMTDAATPVGRPEWSSARQPDVAAARRDNDGDPSLQHRQRGTGASFGQETS